MRTLGAADWLSVWDAAAGASAWARSERVAGAAWPDQDLSADTPGHRNGRLITLHRSLFGPRLSCVSTCPGCGALLESTMDADELLSLQGSSSLVGAVDSAVLVRHNGIDYSFRLPRMRDVADLVNEGTNEALRLLLRRCLIEGDPAAIDDPKMVQALDDAFDAADPLGHLAVELLCPQCGEGSLPVLDVAALLWSELGAMVDQMLEQVHTLATSYGWSETEILSLPAERRNRYLEKIRR
jgi:hypothetical protein